MDKIQDILEGRRKIINSMFAVMMVGFPALFIILIKSKEISENVNNKLFIAIVIIEILLLLRYMKLKNDEKVFLDDISKLSKEQIEIITKANKNPKVSSNFVNISKVGVIVINRLYCALIKYEDIKDVRIKEVRYSQLLKIITTDKTYSYEVKDKQEANKYCENIKRK